MQRMHISKEIEVVLHLLLQRVGKFWDMIRRNAVKFRIFADNIFVFVY